MATPRKSFAVFVPRTSGFAHRAFSEQRLSKATRMSVRVRGALRVRPCGEPDALEGRLEGVVRLPGFGTQVVFRSARPIARAGVTHVTNETILVPAGGEIEIPHQWVRWRQEPESPLAVQFTSAAGAPLSEPVLLGRAARGLYVVDCEVAGRVTVGAWVAARDCASHHVDLAITGEITFGDGILARVVAAPDDPDPLPDAIGVIQVVAPGTPVLAAERLVVTHAPPSPEVSIQFRDERGAAIGEEATLGVCIPADWTGDAGRAASSRGW
jgi:hypothetical protein